MILYKNTETSDEYADIDQQKKVIDNFCKVSENIIFWNFLTEFFFNQFFRPSDKKIVNKIESLWSGGGGTQP